MGLHFASEKILHSAVDAWFSSIGLPYKSHPTLKNGCCPDFSFLIDGNPWGYLEIKNGLDPLAFQLKDAGDYFEQCLKYQNHTSLPVFLGPFFAPTMGVVSNYLSGGHEPKTIAAFSCIAGRANVGLCFINAEPGYEHDHRYWYGFRLLLRQTTIAQGYSRDGWASSVWPEAVEMVCMDGAASSKVRV